MYKGKERRKYPRTEGTFIISYRILRKSDGFDLTRTKNVSQGGILLTTNRPFDKGTKLLMVIKFPFVMKRIEVVGDVVSSSQVVRGLIYETRIKFINLDKDLFVKIGELVKQRLSSKQ